jgi:hypothetical protein
VATTTFALPATGSSRSIGAAQKDDSVLKRLIRALEQSGNECAASGGVAWEIPTTAQWRHRGGGARRSGGLPTTKQFAAALGFGFVAAWIALNLRYAILCLVGAAVFYGAAGVLQGEVDLGDATPPAQRRRSGLVPFAHARRGRATRPLSVSRRAASGAFGVDRERVEARPDGGLVKWARAGYPLPRST